MEFPRSRSPLKVKPLRLPGQSVDEALEKLVWNELVPHLLFAVIFVILAGFEWFAALTQLPPQPWLFTSLAVAASLYAARRVGDFERRSAAWLWGEMESGLWPKNSTSSARPAPK